MPEDRLREAPSDFALQWAHCKSNIIGGVKRGAGSRQREEVVHKWYTAGNNEQFKQPNTKSKHKVTFPEFENRQMKKAGRERKKIE